jgi:hypothetical protein
MSINSLKIDSDVDKGNADSLGGGFTKPTGLYPCKIDMAYMSKSKGGALALNIHYKPVDGSPMIRDTQWVTSGDAKGNKNYYVNQSGKKFLLPGMQLADQVAQIAANCPMADCDVDKKIIKLWDRDAQAEKPQEVPVVTSLLGADILVGLIKHRENRRVNDGSGNYVPTPDERIFNEVDKVFHADGYSVTEKEAEAEEAVFHKQWASKYPNDYVEDTFDSTVAATDDDSLPEGATVDTSGLFA